MAECELYSSYSMSEEEQFEAELLYFDATHPLLNGSNDPVVGAPNYGFIDTPESEAQLASMKEYWASPEGVARLKYQEEYDAQHPWENDKEMFKSFEQSKKDYENSLKKGDKVV